MTNKIELQDNWRATYPVRHDSPFAKRTDELISDMNWEPSIGVKEYLADLNNEDINESYRTWVKNILPILPALIEWNSINPSCVELIKEEGEKSFYRRTLLQVRYNPGSECCTDDERSQAMREYEKLLNISEIATQLVSWMRLARSSNKMKYAQYFRELIQSLPKESALRLLRVHVQREPRFAGLVIPEGRVEQSYFDIMHPEAGGY